MAKGDERILFAGRSPYPARREGEMECTAVIFGSGDLAWDLFEPASTKNVFDKERGFRENARPCQP